ncbi:MAG: phosphate signaling complex protein PhoU [Rhodospirillaceae bacterium]|nr:phosphate signaling complex protein PhoU [Rhodospirillaceae bacterium]MCY4237696.1 phosphate signaling complex protein PhoU [Rhodospirillaceae bacterium]MCY4311554.1 phosphate signaling complex protein PhoU [Rhodospirillaceae bacterium]
MASDHIVTSYDEELTELKSKVSEMGGLAEAQLENALEAMQRRDTEIASRTIEADFRVDNLEQEIDQFVVQLLALRQPMASDLREIIVALKISSDLERIADYATNVAKRTMTLAHSPQVRPAHAIPRMARLALTMINDVLDSYADRDTQKAIAVWHRDEELDEMYTSLFRELLTYMMEDARSISSCTHLLFIAKNIERVGDHATNIAEYVYYLVEGKPLLQSRPKGGENEYERLDLPKSQA